MDDGTADEEGGIEDGGIVTESLHPNQPGVEHVVEDSVIDVVVVTVVKAGLLAGFVMVLDMVVVVESRHPNHPGVLQVVDVVVVVLVVIAEVVVVSSRHPHQPGVLQVSVRVRVCVFVARPVDVVVVSLLLLSKNFQL